MKLLIRIVKDVMNMTGMTLPKPHQERRVALVVLALAVMVIAGMLAAAALLVRVVQ